MFQPSAGRFIAVGLAAATAAGAFMSGSIDRYEGPVLVPFTAGAFVVLLAAAGLSLAASFVWWLLGYNWKPKFYPTARRLLVAGLVFGVLAVGLRYVSDLVYEGGWSSWVNAAMNLPEQITLE
ncbi:MAG: hypothetical protein JNL96_09285 [Planctomycetaceae bacterium]|nr:hypothetical protein [Planctomycetaceae bacterium]